MSLFISQLAGGKIWRAYSQINHDKNVVGASVYKP